MPTTFIAYSVCANLNTIYFKESELCLCLIKADFLQPNNLMIVLKCHCLLIDNMMNILYSSINDLHFFSIHLVFNIINEKIIFVIQVNTFFFTLFIRHHLDSFLCALLKIVTDVNNVGNIKDNEVHVVRGASQRHRLKATALGHYHFH